jgi:phosphate transport system permease protein
VDTLTTLPRLETDASVPEPRELDGRRGRGDRIFFTGATASGFVVMSIMVAFGVFLSIQATQALRLRGLKVLTTAAWEPDRGVFGIAWIMTGTVLVAVVAVVIALPISMGTALFITEVAPARVRSTLVALIDLMAAVPSLVYGLWGAYLLQGNIIPISRWIGSWFGWIPVLHVSGALNSDGTPNLNAYASATFIGGVVVAMMVMPIQTVVMREVFSQVPLGEREGAFALGATRWGMIRVVAMPFGRGGIIGGTMLGLGRALGETIAVALILSPVYRFNWHLLESGGNTVSLLIATKYKEASGIQLSALFAAGLALFAVTLVVNFTASWFVARSRSGASSDA